MSKLQKLIAKILSGHNVSYKEAEKLLLGMGFSIEIRGSHHVFRKMGYMRNVSLKIRPQLLPYQIKLLMEVLRDHDY